MPEDRIAAAIGAMREELAEQLEKLQTQGKAARGPAFVRPHPVRSRDAAGGRALPRDRKLQSPAVGKAPGDHPTRCTTTFPKDFVTLVDESHVTIPQIRAMYAGDRSSKNDAGRARIPFAQRAGQPADEV